MTACETDAVRRDADPGRQLAPCLQQEGAALTFRKAQWLSLDTQCFQGNVFDV
jgi:hypothetical protein